MHGQPRALGTEDVQALVACALKVEREALRGRPGEALWFIAADSQSLRHSFVERFGNKVQLAPYFQNPRRIFRKTPARVIFRAVFSHKERRLFFLSLFRGIVCSWVPEAFTAYQFGGGSQGGSSKARARAAPARSHTATRDALARTFAEWYTHPTSRTIGYIYVIRNSGRVFQSGCGKGLERVTTLSLSSVCLWKKS